MDNKPVALSGIQPTGIFTIGNYLGAVKNWHIMQKKFNCIFFIANLHSLTVKQDVTKFKNFTLNCVALLLACGINLDESLVFVQSQVKQHTELSWILQCNTQFSELKRMTQFKDKSQKNADNINSGLFSYPVLMAADILLYEPDFVPVGLDQKQHLELTNVVANRFNYLYGETFKIPKPYILKTGAKIKSLSNPDNKMSKSEKNKNGVVFMLDEPDIILEKFKKAVTDSDNVIVFDLDKKPGISNLIEIYSSFADISIEEVEKHFKSTNYSIFKEEVGKIVVEKLRPIREKYFELIKDQDYLEEICRLGSIKATKIAENKMNQINKKLGILN